MSDCLFCKIAAKEGPSTIAYEDDNILAFHDIYPLAPVHILVIPKKHIDSLHHLQEEDQWLFGALLNTVKDLAVSFGIAESGYRVVTNIGSDGAQAVKHLHFHLMGGKALGSKLG